MPSSGWVDEHGDKVNMDKSHILGGVIEEDITYSNLLSDSPFNND